MANRKVTLVWTCKTEKGWRRFPVVFGRNGRIRKGVVQVDGNEHSFPDGHFEIRFYEGTRMLYENAGDDSTEAILQRDRKAALLIARDHADAAGAAIVEEPSRILLSRKLQEFVQHALDRRAFEAAEVNRKAVQEFLDVSGRRYADEITAEDVRAFWRALRARGCGDRTVYNKHLRLGPFLRTCGISLRELVGPAPKFDKKLPDEYSSSDIKKLAAASTPYEQVAFDLLLKTGLRDQEAQHLEWSDIDFKHKALTVHSKPQYNFRIKDYEERQIPIPNDTLARLKKWRKEHPNTVLVIGNENDQPNSKLLRALKRAVTKAGLACKRCDGCKKNGECRNFTLHKFRRSYATKLLRNGVDLRTVQSFMGHADLESTMRYLTPATASATQEKLNAIAWT